VQLERPDPSLGVFETVLVREGRVHLLDAHLARLRRSLSELYGLGLPAGLRALTVRRAETLDAPHRLRVDVVPDGDALTVELKVSALTAGQTAAAVCTPVVVPGGLGSHKWCDRRLLDSLAPTGRIPLLVDDDGDVLEAGPANVWLIEDSRLVTPPADGRILPGVTRELLLDLSPSVHLNARVEPVSIERLRDATAIFLTSSLRLAAAASLDEPIGEDPALVVTIRDLLGRGG
jgi:para-aminobenzoate synthetase/4-amino-4-deoxychorismate lyase